MKKWVVLFNIKNNQKEYAYCLDIIDILQKNEGFCQSSMPQIEVSIMPYDKAGFPENIIELRSIHPACNMSEIKEEDQIKYLFNVKSEDGDDIINLLYYCLVYDRVAQTGHASALYVNCDNKQDANIRDLLTWLLHSETIKHCYTLTGEKIHKIKSDRIDRLKTISRDKVSGVQRDKVRIMKQFSPIFRIDESVREGDYGSVTYWRQPMRVFLRKIYQSMAENQEPIPISRRDNSEITFGINYFLPHVLPTNLFVKNSGEIWHGKKGSREKHLLSIFIECFCSVSSEQSKCVKTSIKDFNLKRYGWWKSEKLYEQIKEIPLLAMYIFCMSDYFMRNLKQDSWDRIEQEIFDARDMADGMLQILENIYHSENGKGYFCFRIHTDLENRSRDYLNKEYKVYMEDWNGCENAPLNYLEIKIADFSHCSIPTQFYENFKKRMKQVSDEDNKLYKKLESRASALSVSSFFGEYSDFWDSYHMISENAVHHYGLQVFESLISCYEGYFRIRSQETKELNSERELYATHETDDISLVAIPGTQYDILVPFREQTRMQNLSVDVNINYTDGLLKNYNDHVCENIELVEDTCTAILKEINIQYPDDSYQERKERTIRVLAEKLDYLLRNVNSTDSCILHFSAERIPMSRIELFCKAIMLKIARKQKKQNFYAMITECTSAHFVEITRMMALFYNKQGANSHMKNTQIFMSGKKEGEEFLITGSNLSEAIGSTEKLAFARCTPPDCLKILKKMLRNHKMGTTPNDIVSIVPFDMIRFNKDKPTLLERRLTEVLNQDVQSDKFGCKLENLHVRIGSKIHIQTFFEAELLFHNNYYTSRFAYWLYNELLSSEDLDLEKPFVLVGCESYSEMLLNELCGMFEKTKIKTEYLIYEERIAGKFRGKKRLDCYIDYQFVIIVPINSTLTTHIKIFGFLEKSIRSELEKSKVPDYNQYSLDKVLNYGIVLIDTDSSERDNYWHREEGKKNVIVSNINHKTMTYYIKIMSEWLNPLTCEACFPAGDYTKEIPLVETNKESVVPMHAIGMKKSGMTEMDKSDHDDKNMRDLSKILVYRHVERNGNHFNFYFATEKIWNFPSIRNKIRHWLEKKKAELFKKEQCKVYDIIVAPLHYSNTVFVEEVNGCLFENAALVLHFDVDKEFRMNTRTKYSSIQQLYDNLSEDNEQSIINFHYVDDTIVSGRVCRRMKSLVSSLIQKNKNQNVRINVFKSIVLLLNRMSKSSIRDYIEDQNYFLAYFNLKISSMRVNSDACVLCKKYAEWKKLAQQASLNNVFNYWQKKSERLKCVPVDKISVTENRNSIKEKRNISYMIASHRAKELLDAVCDYENMTQSDVQHAIVEILFPDEITNSVDELIAMLKVLGRPFLSFRREAKEAVFSLMLIMLDTLLCEMVPSGEEKLYRILREIWNNAEYRIKIIEILMNRLAELESNYIIRQRSMNKIINFCILNIKSAKKQQRFMYNYLNRIKQFVGQSNDFTKGLFLEYLLLYNEEFQSGTSQKDIVSMSGKGIDIVFRKNAYLENTKLINYGIEYLAESFSDNRKITEKSLIQTFNENYYFDNFIQYLVFHKVIAADDNGKVTGFVSDTEQKKIEGMVRFELLYQRIFGEIDAANVTQSALEQRKTIAEENIKDKYKEMIECLRDASGALDGEIIVPYGNAEGDTKYIALELCASTELRSLENNERDLWEFMKRNRYFEENTYAICNSSTTNLQKWILLKFFDNASSGNGDISVIYMLFPFDTQSKDEILHSLKNILIFRHKIWKILNLSSSTLLRNWTDNLFYKQQMLKSRAVGHSELDKLMEQFKDFSELICETYQTENDSHKKVYRAHFELLVNSMIGAMNVKVLGNQIMDNRESIKHNFMTFWSTLQRINDAISKVWNLKITISEEELSGYSIRCIREEISEKFISPDFMVLQILFLTIFHNIWKHGKQDENLCCDVSLSVKDEKLYISNYVDEENKKKIEQAIQTEAYRSGQGISQAVIYDICKSWYRDTRYQDFFDICQIQNGDDNRWLYVVKLPIIERRWSDEKI